MLNILKDSETIKHTIYLAIMSVTSGKFIQILLNKLLSNFMISVGGKFEFLDTNLMKYNMAFSASFGQPL